MNLSNWTLEDQDLRQIATRLSSFLTTKKQHEQLVGTGSSASMSGSSRETHNHGHINQHHPTQSHSHTHSNDTEKLKLTALSFAGNSRLTDAGLVALLSSTRPTISLDDDDSDAFDLQNLNLRGCAHVKFALLLDGVNETVVPTQCGVIQHHLQSIQRLNLGGTAVGLQGLSVVSGTRK